ncbi:mitochondrial ribosomal protein L37-domain-containing protein [Favolaschia claudopus]|uniref:Large ribosomal subunit protein mL54 n=1 Tax=Favolaschia claudopus TaxID=2862362 RepID=A0AAW0D6L8_9AGAR
MYIFTSTHFWGFFRLFAGRHGVTLSHMYFAIFRRSCISLGPRTRSYASKAAAAAKSATPINVKKVPSSCATDTIITGANYLKGQSPVVALPDEEYPPWLWTVLEQRVWPDDGPGGRAERAARRKENKKRIQDANFMSTQ